MAAPYSYDLRTKAISAVKRGERKSDVCRMLKMGVVKFLNPESDRRGISRHFIAQA